MKGDLEQDLDKFGDKFGISLTDNAVSLQIFITAQVLDMMLNTYLEPGIDF